MKDRDLLLYGLFIVGGYFLYKKFSVSINAAANSIAQPIANEWVDLTSPAAPVPQGSVAMPDGSYFPVANLTNMNMHWVGNVLQFALNGATYALSPQVNGVYQATRIS